MIATTDTTAPTTTITAETLADILDELTTDGDTFDMPDGSRLVLAFRPDSDASINDYDSDGRTEWARNGDYGPERPAGMTGNARIIDRERGSALWWEPYNDLMGWQDDAGTWHHAKWGGLPAEVQSREESRIRDLVAFGWVGVTLRREETCSAGHWHAVSDASVWGLEWDIAGTEYMRVVVEGLLMDICITDEDEVEG